MRDLAECEDGVDPVVHLALKSTASTLFLAVDTSLVRLLELAAGRARDDAIRARLLARLARELLGEASAVARRRALADEALRLARRAGDPGVLADVLDARLHAVWDQGRADDRLATGSEIIGLARLAGDGERERLGMFWRFMALMELGRVAEAESALAAFAHDASAAGDAEATVLATARHAMLAILRGRFDRAVRLTGEAGREARRLVRPDAEAVTMTLMGAVALEQGGCGELGASGKEWREHAPDYVLASASERPGHLLEATAARLLLAHGRVQEASAELDRSLNRALASSGPRRLGAMADLAVVAAETGEARAAARLYAAMLPYRGRLVVQGGAAVAFGPVTHYLGLLAAATGQTADAVRQFEDAIEFEDRIGALPFLAHSLAGLAGALARSGDTSRAAACTARARDIARRLGMTVMLRQPEKLMPLALKRPDASGTARRWQANRGTGPVGVGRAVRWRAGQLRGRERRDLLARRRGAGARARVRRRRPRSARTRTGLLSAGPAVARSARRETCAAALPVGARSHRARPREPGRRSETRPCRTADRTSRPRRGAGAGEGRTRLG